jgi:hypothetical protein
MDARLQDPFLAAVARIDLSKVDYSQSVQYAEKPKIGRPRLPIPCKEVQAWAEVGTSLRDLALAFDCSRETIARACDGKPQAKQPGGRYPVLSEETAKELLRWWKSGAKIPDLAFAFEINRWTIWELCGRRKYPRSQIYAKYRREMGL